MSRLIKQKKYHLLLIVILIVISGLLEGIVYFHYDAWFKQPVVLNQSMKIIPTYNYNGSWLHGKLGIGYIAGLLLLEDIVVLCLLLWFFRLMDAMACFFQTSRNWLYVLDFGIACTIYRLFTRIRGRFTLDYLCINGSVYDFPDFCIGILLAGMILWIVVYLFVYYRFRGTKVKELSFSKKQIWDLKFCGMFLKVSVLPRDRWQAEFELWK